MPSALKFFGPQRTLTVDSLKAIRMDLTPWLDEDEDDMQVVDFVPFSGTALLVGLPAPPVLVLDYLGTN
jgi:hypothetical protein